MDSSANTVRNKAAEIFGGFEAGDDWLNTPARGLDYKTPNHLLNTEAGRQEVLDMLTRIDFGVYW